MFLLPQQRRCCPSAVCRPSSEAAGEIDSPGGNDTLVDTSDGLGPQRWEGPYNDKKLARLQFAAALVEALDAAQSAERAPLARAAEWVAELQEKDSSWQTDKNGGVGWPVTHGAAVATNRARRTLLRADPEKYRAAIARADAWARSKPIETVIEAAAALLLLDRADDDAARTQRKTCLALIRAGEARKGCWGPAPVLRLDGRSSPRLQYTTCPAPFVLPRPAEQASRQLDHEWPSGQPAQNCSQPLDRCALAADTTRIVPHTKLQLSTRRHHDHEETWRCSSGGSTSNGPFPSIGLLFQF